MRIRVLVVEDEPPIKRSIVHCIEQRGDSFEVVGTAMNGRKALEIIASTPVDVVFTDIRMPVMDGLELSARLREAYPDIEVVIISGYQEFAYMRQALVSKVTDYLLKPVTAASMQPVLDKLEERVNGLRLRRRRHALEEAISGGQSIVSGAGERYGVFLLCAGAYPLVEDAMLPGRAFWNGLDLEMLMDALVRGSESCMCFAGKTSAEMVALVQLEDESRIDEISAQLLKQLNCDAAIAVTVGCADAPVSIAGIGETLKRMRNRLHTETKLFSAQIICESGEAAPERDGQFARSFEHALHDALHACDAPALEGTMRECVDSFTQAGVSEIQLVHFLESVLNANVSLFEAQAATRKLELRAAVSNATGAEPLARDLAYLFSSLFDGTGEVFREREPAIIAQIERYLREHFDKSITSTVLAEQFGFVPSYISKLFRAYRGLSPSEFLTRCRIERAKELMEENPALLFKEVAAQVGFSDQYYFSKIFKKETGMWPTEFAKQK